jgi:hypothetical protein
MEGCHSAVITKVRDDILVGKMISLEESYAWVFRGFPQFLDAVSGIGHEKDTIYFF